MRFEWKEQYSVGESSIDSQHKVLVGLIADVQQAMLEGRVSEELSEVLDKLLTYTQYHFTWEEQWLESCGVGELAAHHAEHEQLTGEVLELIKRLKEGRLTAGMPVLRLLQNWLLEHIDVRDRAVVARALKLQAETTPAA